MKKIVCLLLPLLLTSCTFTDQLWGEYKGIIDSEFYKEESFAVSVLNKNEIALFVNLGVEHKDSSQVFKNLATIYKFRESEYLALKDQVKSVNIKEQIHISYKERNITKEKNSFKITLDNGTVISPQYVDTTLAHRTGKELIFGGTKINFDRRVYFDGKEFSHDYSFLYRVPLTPIAVTGDLVKSATLTGVTIVVLPVLGVMCFIGPCN